MKKVLCGALFVALLLPSISFAKSEVARPENSRGKSVLAREHQYGANMDLLLNAKSSETAKSVIAEIKAFQLERKNKVSLAVTQLKKGSKGEAVKKLQTLLALDPTVYPEGVVSGTYGPLTTKAVQRFQKLHGLAPVGTVGPATVAKLKEMVEANELTVEDNGRLCAIIPPGHLISPGFLKKNPRPTIPACQILPPGIAKKLADIVPVPDPSDKTAPVISAVASSEATATTVKVTWTTDEVSKSNVWYGTVNPVVTTGTPTATDATFTTSHVLNLTGLTASTTYYYAVGSVDASGNASISAQGTFTTTAPDTTAPIISVPAVSAITATGATVTWTTNETTTSKIWVSTAPTVDTAGTATMSSATLTTTPSFTLTGLVANTVYNYIVKSTDSSSNTTASAQGTFTTAL